MYLVRKLIRGREDRHGQLIQVGTDDSVATSIGHQHYCTRLGVVPFIGPTGALIRKHFSSLVQWAGARSRWDLPNTSMWRDAQRPIGELPSDRQTAMCPTQVPRLNLAVDEKHPHTS